MDDTPPETFAASTVINVIATDRKFFDPFVTAEGRPRAQVKFRGLKTLWLNTGTLCNLTCENCYIESSPKNDRLTYLSRADVNEYLKEIAEQKFPVEEIGITGGEPFMNPQFLTILEDCLSAGFNVLVLTNAMKPMMKCADGLLALRARFAQSLTIRVSVDHFDRAMHEEERGPRSWAPMLKGLRWLSDNGFQVHAAGRTRWGEDEKSLRSGFAELFAREKINIDADDSDSLLLFPEMEDDAEVPEITTDCWSILGVDPGDMMCASSRMIVRRRGSAHAEVVACTLLPYEAEFSLGTQLPDSFSPIPLNHKHCAKFCVLGGGSCSA
jgi:uncharacterized Fe-S cluster-containing radical SAM superfamily protein